MKSTINKQQLLLEFVSVVFAVILALILNGWRESSALNKSLEKVKESIKKEAIRNDSLIRQSNVYRKDLLQTFYANENLLLAIPITDFPIDVNNNKALASYFKTALIFGQKDFYERVQIMQEDDARVLILDGSVFDLKVESDTLKLLGIGGIQLRIPDLSNRSWELAQATGTIVKMNVGLVESLSIVNGLIDTYRKASDNALQIVYSNNQKGLLSAIEDIYNLEKKIIEENTTLIEALILGSFKSSDIII